MNYINDERNGIVCARPGELFAKVPLTDHLNEDTDAGKQCIVLVLVVMMVT